MHSHLAGFPPPLEPDATKAEALGLSSDERAMLNYVATYPRENFYRLSDGLGTSPMKLSGVLFSKTGQRYLRLVMWPEDAKRLVAKIRRRQRKALAGR